MSTNTNKNITHPTKLKNANWLYQQSVKLTAKPNRCWSSFNITDLLDDSIRSSHVGQVENNWWGRREAHIEVLVVSVVDAEARHITPHHQFLGACNTVCSQAEWLVYVEKQRLWTETKSHWFANLKTTIYAFYKKWSVPEVVGSNPTEKGDFSSFSVWAHFPGQSLRRYHWVFFIKHLTIILWNRGE